MAKSHEKSFEMLQHPPNIPSIRSKALGGTFLNNNFENKDNKTISARVETVGSRAKEKVFVSKLIGIPFYELFTSRTKGHFIN